MLIYINIPKGPSLLPLIASWSQVTDPYVSCFINRISRTPSICRTVDGCTPDRSGAVAGVRSPMIIAAHCTKGRSLYAHFSSPCLNLRACRLIQAVVGEHILIAS